MAGRYSIGEAATTCHSCGSSVSCQLALPRQSAELARPADAPSLELSAAAPDPTRAVRSRVDTARIVCEPAAGLAQNVSPRRTLRGGDHPGQRHVDAQLERASPLAARHLGAPSPGAALASRGVEQCGGPQPVRQSGTSTGVLLGCLASYFGGYAIWVVYGASIQSLPRIVVDAVGIASGGWTFAMALPGRPSPRAPESVSARRLRPASSSESGRTARHPPRAHTTDVPGVHMTLGVPRRPRSPRRSPGRSDCLAPAECRRRQAVVNEVRPVEYDRFTDGYRESRDQWRSTRSARA
jgi:hypothetical protein